MSHFFPSYIPDIVSNNLEVPFFSSPFGAKMQLCGKCIVHLNCKLGNLENEMVRTTAAAPSSIPIKLDELKLK